TRTRQPRGPRARATGRDAPRLRALVCRHATRTVRRRLRLADHRARHARRSSGSSALTAAAFPLSRDNVIDKTFSSTSEALADVPDGATVMSGGFGGAGQPAELIDALIAQGAR